MKTSNFTYHSNSEVKQTTPSPTHREKSEEINKKRKQHKLNKVGLQREFLSFFGVKLY